MLIELHFLPTIQYFSFIKNNEQVCLEAQEYYQKQTYRNRTKILTANGIDTLTVPIEHQKPKMLIRDVPLVSSENWNIRHWRSIEAAYRKAPYFEYFGDYFTNVFYKPNKFLFDFNFELLSICLKLLKINATIDLTQVYERTVEIGQFDARELIHPKKQSDFTPKAYKQNFGNEFVPNLSIIDLLMCQGTRAKEFI